MEDTIAAVATAYGEGGIGIIRISGEEALPILQEIFEFHGDTDTFISRRMTYGKIIDKEKNQIIDEVFGCLYERSENLYSGRCGGNQLPWKYGFSEKNAGTCFAKRSKTGGTGRVYETCISQWSSGSFLRRKLL